MLIRDSGLSISKAAIVEAFSASKQTVVKESDEKAFDTYNQLAYVEFLELMARIAIIFFRDSEMHAASLKWKLLYVLEKVFANTTQMKVNQTVVEIEEFSDSDDDY